MKSSFRNAPYTKQNIYGNVIFNRLAPGTFKIYQWSFSKVAALKRIEPSIRKTIKVMQSLIELSKVLLKFVSETFSK